MVPALVNEGITLIKDSSLVSAIGLAELALAACTVAGAYSRYWEALPRDFGGVPGVDADAVIAGQAPENADAFARALKLPCFWVRANRAQCRLNVAYRPSMSHRSGKTAGR